MGLEVLQKDVRKPIPVDKGSLMETVDDLLGAANIAVATLNDVLLVEKINGSLLKLDMTRISARDFVMKSLHTFKLQVYNVWIQIKA